MRLLPVKGCDHLLATQQEFQGSTLAKNVAQQQANAKYYLPQMFGQNHYQILSSPTELITSLVKLYEKIKN